MQAAAAAADESDALLVVGSSMQVFSAFRLARAAAKAEAPIAILNVGPTRCDELSSLRINADACDVLPLLVERLGVREYVAPSVGVRGFG